MKFYNRTKELEELELIRQQSIEHSQMTFIIGRRRIGKTKLILQSTKDQPVVYFFTARKAEPLLCRDFTEEIATTLNIPFVGEVYNFSALFKMLIQYSQNHPFNLIIDEFQEFWNINPSVYSDMQNIWDQYKDVSHLNLILSGSIYSLMHKIFENNKGPLYGRANHKFVLRPFSPYVLKDILNDYHPNYSNEDLLALYAFTGGVPKYVELLMDNKAFTYRKMIDFMLRENSIFINEGKNILIEEFGKEYTRYFSILSCIAAGFTTRSQIESYLQQEIGGYLTRLEGDFNLIGKKTPLFSKSLTKNVHYNIKDHFLRFWFRFIYKYQRFIESGAIEQLKELIDRDYPTYSGVVLECYFFDKFKETHAYTTLGSYWDRKGENEIDLIALDELNKKALVAEIKRQKNKINLSALQRKATVLNESLAGYQVSFAGLSLEDM
jgi:AAA+ ATPase superfamily predicted ATPase